MINPVRGEVAVPPAAASILSEIAVPLAGAVWKMRPTFAAMIEIEQQTGMKIVALAQAFAVKDFGARDVAVVLSAGIRAAGDTGATLERVGRVIEQIGVLNPDLIQAITDYLRMCLGGGAKGEAAAVGEKEPTTSPTADISDTRSLS